MARSPLSLLLAGCLLFAVPKQWSRSAFAPPPRAGRVLRKATQPGTESVIEVAPTKKVNETNVTLEEEKRARVLAKTAETKERVEEKKQRMRAEARSRDIATPSEKPLLDWKEFAAQARSIAEESQKEAAKKEGEEVEVFLATAKESFFQLLAVGCETAAKVPPVLQGFSVFFLVLLISFNAKQSPETEVRSVPASPAPTVVVTKPPVTQAQVPASPKAPPMAPVPVPKKASLPPVSEGSFASSAANVLRSIADGLPAAQKTVEENLPAAQSAGQSALKWASELNSENAAEKVEKEALPSAGRFAAEALKLGLQVGASGLQFVGENLPAAEEALGSAVDKGLPYAQSALREVASTARRVAQDGVPVDTSDPTAQKAAAAVPGLLSATAGVLDSAADLAPATKSVLGYAAGAATPLAQAALSAASGLVKDVSEVPPETVGEGLTQVAESIESIKQTAPTALDTAKQLLKTAQVPQLPQVPSPTP